MTVHVFPVPVYEAELLVLHGRFADLPSAVKTLRPEVQNVVLAWAVDHDPGVGYTDNARGDVRSVVVFVWRGCGL